MHGQIVLTPLARTSPTLWSHMRLCRLRGAFASSPAVDRWILHEPRAWLGTAFHRLMAGAPGDPSAKRQVFGDSAIAEILTEASRHCLDGRFANPERWPGDHLVRQRAIAAAVGKGGRRSVARPRGSPGGSPPVADANACSRRARDGSLAGRISSTAPPSPNTSRRCPTRFGRMPPALSTGTGGSFAFIPF